METYGPIDGKLSFSTFYRAWRTYIEKNNITESDKGRFALCLFCSRLLNLASKFSCSNTMFMFGD